MNFSISRLVFDDPLISEEVTIATFSSSRTLSGLGMLYRTRSQAFLVKGSTVQKLINNRLDSLQLSVGIVNGKKVLKIGDTEVITVTGCTRLFINIVYRHGKSKF